MHFLNRTVAIITVVFLTIAASAENGKAPDPLFQNNDMLQVTITAPLTTLVDERSKEDYLPGLFEYTEADGTAVDLDIEIRTRGNFRHRTCEFPPLRLNFKKAQTDGTLFDKQKIMKLVVHCDKSSRYEQIVLREYLIYQIFNAITDLSFRARLLRVTYVDSEERRNEQVRYAFLIEHKKRLAKRHDMKEVIIERASTYSIQPDELNLTSIFQFLIGNTDFSPLAGAPGEMCCHNYVLFGNDIDPIVAVPYDFDQSGFVNAPYASPSSNFRIRSVRQRLYRGRCLNNEHVPTSLQKFQDGRDAIYALLDAQEELSSSTRKSLVKYVDGFYKLIDDPRDVEKQIIDACIGA